MTKKRFTAPTLGLENAYFTWDTMSGAGRNANIVNKLKEYIMVHFWDQANVALTTRMLWSNKDHTTKNRKRNPGTKKENSPKVENWEHKLVVDEYLESYKTKEGIKDWAEKKRCMLPPCPPVLLSRAGD